MKPELAKYADKKICAAVSGGRDSMALLHCLKKHAEEYGITLTALNCDHGIRGEDSARDSKFVADYCKAEGIRLITFKYDGTPLKSEEDARRWRHSCYLQATTPHVLADGSEWEGADAVATAHHLNDNAETVIFNLARGSALAGLTGIRDCEVRGVNIIHPLIGCTRAEIDGYINKNAIPYVDDKTNFTPDYTRNKLRLSVLPELERAVNGTAENVFRFSRIAAEDEAYFSGIIEERGLILRTNKGYNLAHCPERVIFRRAAVKILTELGKKDYTFTHLSVLYALQFLSNGKKFNFLGLTAYKDGDKIVIEDSTVKDVSEEVSFYAYLDAGSSIFGGQPLQFYLCGAQNPSKKVLKADLSKIPKTSVIRFMRAGDRFKKFGGGTKSLGDFFTDRKIRAEARKRIPLIADGSEILAVCGVEISDKIKITGETQQTFYIISDIL